MAAELRDKTDEDDVAGSGSMWRYTTNAKGRVATTVDKVAKQTSEGDGGGDRPANFPILCERPNQPAQLATVVGKGRDVGLNQIALFEGKVAGGNGEQVLSRDVYRLGQLFDFFRMLSFYFTTVGFYVCTMMTVLTVYIFLYGKAYLALSGLDKAITTEAGILDNTALEAALNTQFLFQIGVFTAVPMIMGFVLEQGLLKAIVNFITMQLQLCSVFFTFSLGTRTHYFGRTILHGGAKYRATGRGFVVRHIKFAENYRLYSRSHFVKGFEVALLLIVYVGYGYAKGGVVAYILLTISSWFLAVSWLFAPYIFNPAGFEWQKTVQDFDDWTSWLLFKGGVGAKADESWEAWWDEEQVHIRTLRGRIFETILSLRFFLFQYGIVYKLHATGKDTSIVVYGKCFDMGSPFLVRALNPGDSRLGTRIASGRWATRHATRRSRSRVEIFDSMV
ncbi:hypothetical protein KI387_014269 [Taxus chinensis]|uniref:Glycosyl transferase 48 domain-containing protein n=1 Tax=Taxus chinensis TaxID=29808 RepID=A0AA38CN35_TAXCH|nr:hypothetical protein KI387_014269 [Taxus chinensis]